MKEKSIGIMAFFTVMVISLFLAGSVLAQGFEEMEIGLRHRMEQLKLEEREVGLEKLRSELDFERKMREIELEKKRAEIKQMASFGQKRKEHREFFGLLFMACIVIHILLAVWVYQDIRKRNIGSGIWIVLVMLGGIPAAAVYAITRIADRKAD